MQFIIIGVVVPIVLKLYSNWALYRASVNKPKTDRDGHLILYHGIPLLTVSFACFAMSIYIITTPLYLFANPINAFGWLVTSFLSLSFVLPGIFIVLEWLKARVTITDNGIFAKAPWPWYPKIVPWANIRRVSYSPLSESFIVEDYKYKVVRISPYFYGITFLCKNIEKHLSPEKYKEAKQLINKIYESSSQ